MVKRVEFLIKKGYINHAENDILVRFQKIKNNALSFRNLVLKVKISSDINERFTIRANELLSIIKTEEFYTMHRLIELLNEGNV